MIPDNAWLRLRGYRRVMSIVRHRAANREFALTPWCLNPLTDFYYLAFARREIRVRPQYQDYNFEIDARDIVKQAAQIDYPLGFQTGQNA